MLVSGRVLGLRSKTLDLKPRVIGPWEFDFFLFILSLGGGFFNIFFSSPVPGEMIQFDEHIFQMGSNHQLVSSIPGR